MVNANLGPKHDLAKRIKKLDDTSRALGTRDILQNASIGAGGLTVNGGNINITTGGSLIVTGGGSIQLPTGTFTANHVVGSTDVTAPTISTTTVNASGQVNVGTNIVAPNGTLVSVYARNHQVVSGYVSAWIDSSGNVLATASAAKFKRDITPYTRDAWRRIQPVLYRLRAAWILADMAGADADRVPFEIGVIADDLLEEFPELVVRDGNGKPWSFHYERLAVVAIDAAQQLAAENESLRADLEALAQRIEKLERP